jgi:hypothetical protein
MDTLSTFALIAGLGWASGVRLYAVLFFLGVLQHAGLYALPEHLQVLAHPAVMAVSGTLFLLEFFADKVPGVDTLWDAVHTFVRIPAGAILAAAAVAGDDAGYAIAAGLLGGTIAAGTHLFKAGGRVLINASPEPISNWTASFGEDVASLTGMAAAIFCPLLFLSLFGVFVVLVIWLMPKLWRGAKRVLARLRAPTGLAQSGKQNPM